MQSLAANSTIPGIPFLGVPPRNSTHSLGIPLCSFKFLQFHNSSCDWKFRLESPVFKECLFLQIPWRNEISMRKTSKTIPRNFRRNSRNSQEFLKELGVSPWIGGSTPESQDFLRPMRDNNTAPESIETLTSRHQTKTKDIFAIDLPVRRTEESCLMQLFDRVNSTCFACKCI